MYYRIKSNAGDLYLSINNNDPKGPLIVNSLREGNDQDSQLWQPIALVNGNNYRGLVLLNKATGLAAYAPNNNAPVIQTPVTQTMTRATWNVAGSAIQLTDDTDMNLNVAGNSPYRPGTPVLAYDWSNGDPNETWTWVAADF